MLFIDWLLAPIEQRIDSLVDRVHIEYLRSICAQSAIYLHCIALLQFNDPQLGDAAPHS